MRGKVFTGRCHPVFEGITPAYAGKSRHSRSESDRPRDHPRVCGEKSKYLSAISAVLGSPPRMRGKVRLTVQGLLPPQDHPRVCGEKDFVKHCEDFPQGSPPRMRGKDELRQAIAVQHRITPAYAGKSESCPVPALRSMDHPRVCGEKS